MSIGARVLRGSHGALDPVFAKEPACAEHADRSENCPSPWPVRPRRVSHGALRGELPEKEVKDYEYVNADRYLVRHKLRRLCGGGGLCSAGLNGE